MPRLGSELLPELNEGALYVTFALPGNTSLTEGRKLTPVIKQLLNRTPEVTGLQSQLGVKIDRRALARYDLDLGDVQDYIETVMGGHVASELWDGENRFDVTVRYPPATREDRGTISAAVLTLLVLPLTYTWACVLRARLGRTASAPVLQGP